MNKKYGFTDAAGNVVVEPIYDKAWDGCNSTEDGLKMYTKVCQYSGKDDRSDRWFCVFPDGLLDEDSVYYDDIEFYCCECGELYWDYCCSNCGGIVCDHCRDDIGNKCPICDGAYDLYKCMCCDREGKGGFEKCKYYEKEYICEYCYNNVLTCFKENQCCNCEGDITPQPGCSDNWYYNHQNKYIFTERT